MESRNFETSMPLLICIGSLMIMHAVGLGERAVFQVTEKVLDASCLIFNQ